MKQWQARLFRRHVAYQQVFLGENGELTPAAKIVLADLAKFAGLGDLQAVVSPISRTVDVPATMQRLGRADAFLRIRRYLRMDVSRLFDTIEGADE